MTRTLLALLVLAGSARADLFDANPAHPFNVVHHALFDRDVEVGAPPCAATKTCLDKTFDQLRDQPSIGVKVRIGGDEPLIFIAEDVWFLEAPARNAAVLRAIDAALKTNPSTNPLAAALLQADVWERFDAIVDWLAHGAPKNRLSLERLLPRLAALIRHLALPRATLAALPSNVAEVARAFPSLLPDFADKRGWAPIRTDFTDAPGSAWQSTTRHAERWGFRFVFRVWVRPSSGLGWLDTHLAPGVELPSQSRLLLVAAPLAITREGELVELPVITLIETRIVGDAAPVRIADMPVAVLEATRAGLLASPRRAGGFITVDGDALVPMGVSCFPNRTTRQPLFAACEQCHGRRANRLTGPLAHGESHVELDNSLDAATRAVIAAKLANPTWQRLHSLITRSSPGL